MRLTNLTNYDLVLKKQKTESVYNRHRLSFGFTYQNLYGNQDVMTNFAYHFAREKRKNIEGNFFFMYGLEPGISFSLLGTPKGFKDLYIMPKIGYTIESQHNIRSNVCINLEIIPSLYAILENDNTLKTDI